MSRKRQNKKEKHDRKIHWINDEVILNWKLNVNPCISNRWIIICCCCFFFCIPIFTHTRRKSNWNVSPSEYVLVCHTSELYIIQAFIMYRFTVFQTRYFGFISFVLFLCVSPLYFVYRFNELFFPYNVNQMYGKRKIFAAAPFSFAFTVQLFDTIRIFFFFLLFSFHFLRFLFYFCVCRDFVFPLQQQPPPSRSAAAAPATAHKCVFMRLC